MIITVITETEQVAKAQDARVRMWADLTSDDISDAVMLSFLPDATLRVVSKLSISNQSTYNALASDKKTKIEMAVVNYWAAIALPSVPQLTGNRLDIADLTYAKVDLITKQKMLMDDGDAFIDDIIPDSTTDGDINVVFEAL